MAQVQTSTHDDAATTAPADRTPEQVASLLKRPFRPEVLRQRPVSGGFVTYAPIAEVIDRLNRAAPVWHWSVTDIRILVLPVTRQGEMLDTPVVHVTGELEIPGLGKRQAVGTAPADSNEDVGKIAESDAMKRAATQFGVPAGR